MKRVCCSVFECLYIRTRVRMNVSVCMHTFDVCVEMCMCCCRVLQCIVECCRVLQSVAGCRRVLQSVAVYCIMLRCVAIVAVFAECCIVLYCLYARTPVCLYVSVCMHVFDGCITVMLQC